MTHLDDMKPPRNLWPLGIVLALLLFFVGTIGLILFAGSQQSELVSDDYYEQELKYQNRIESLNLASRLAVPGSVDYYAAGHRVTVSIPPAHLEENVSGRIQLYRPSTAGLDREYPLEPGANGQQTLDLAGLPRGLWRIRVSWKVGGQDYFLDRKLVIETEESATGVNRR